MNTIMYEKIPVSDLTTLDGKDLVQIYRDYYWLIEDDCTIWNRGRNPMCNMSKGIVENIGLKMLPSCEVIQIPVVYIPIKSNDFDHDVGKLFKK